MSAAGAALSSEIELVSVDTGMGPEDGDGSPLAAGPLARRQDLPPQRAPEPQTPSAPLPPGTIPLSVAGQAADASQQAPAPQTPPPETVFDPDAANEPEKEGDAQKSAAPEVADAPEGTAGGASTGTGTSGDPGAHLPYARIPSGGASGGTGLPGGDTTLGGTGRGGRGSIGQPPASKERRFIPSYRVDRPPKIIRSAALLYPAQAKRRNLEATVVLEADIDEAGNVEEVRVVKPAGFGFDEAAVKYVRESAFSPACVGNTPVAVVMRLAVQFSLSD